MRLPLPLVLVIALGAALRCFGLYWGFPEGLHCDEASVVNHALHLVANVRESHSLNPGCAYGALPLYLALLGGLPTAAVAGLLGLGWEFRTCVLAAGRHISVAADCAAIYCLYLLGLRAGRRVVGASANWAEGRVVGLWAAALYAVALAAVREAHFYSIEPLVGFLMLWHLYCCVRANEEGTVRWFVFCGITLGLALASKMSALPLAVVPALVLIAWAGRTAASGSRADLANGASPATRVFRWSLGALALVLMAGAVSWAALRDRIVAYAEHMAYRTVSTFRLESHSPGFWRQQAESIHGGIAGLLSEGAVVCLLVALVVWWLTRGEAGRRVCAVLWTDRRRLLAVVVVPVAVFVALNPAAVIEPLKYWAPSGPNSPLWNILMGRGALQPPPGWGLQFERSTPFVYQLRHILPYALGWPLAAAAVIGLLWATVRVIGLARGRRDTAAAGLWPAVVGALVLLFTFGTAYFKMSRYMVPLLPYLCLFAAWWLVSVARRPAPAGRPYVSVRAPRLARLALAACWLGGLIWCLAYLPVYVPPDTRDEAVGWIVTHAPPGAKVVVEKDDAWSAALLSLAAGTTYRTELLRPYHITHDLYGQPLTRTDLEGKREYIRETLADADYYLLTPSNRERVTHLRDRFPVVSAFWDDLFAERAGFRLVTDFENGPRLGPWRIDDSDAEVTFRLFDHPDVFIFHRKPGTPAWNPQTPIAAKRVAERR